MSILIKGMEMPKHGMVINIYADGRVSNHFDEFCETIATAVPVPPHGRLIDADALYKEAFRQSEKEEGYYNCLDAVISAYDIANAPTIIPADYPKEKE